MGTAEIAENCITEPLLTALLTIKVVDVILIMYKPQKSLAEVEKRQRCNNKRIVI